MEDKARPTRRTARGAMPPEAKKPTEQKNGGSPQRRAAYLPSAGKPTEALSGSALLDCAATSPDAHKTAGLNGDELLRVRTAPPPAAPPDEEAMWRAVSVCDAAFDGVFYYAVSTTGVFCRPSCKSKHPRREHVRYFGSAAEARAAGFRPCKRCRSDLTEYQPMTDMAGKIRALLDGGFTARAALADGLRGLGLSRRRMGELFKTVYGVSPGAYVAALRLVEARRRLTETREPLTDIAFAVGFESLGGFYRFFSEQEGISPAAYRRQNGEGREADDVGRAEGSCVSNA